MVTADQTICLACVDRWRQRYCRILWSIGRLMGTLLARVNEFPWRLLMPRKIKYNVFMEVISNGEPWRVPWKDKPEMYTRDWVVSDVVCGEMSAEVESQVLPVALLSKTWNKTSRRIRKRPVKIYRVPRPGFGKNLPEKNLRPPFFLKKFFAPLFF